MLFSDFTHPSTLAVLLVEAILPPGSFTFGVVLAS
jgi:hypothetical protein